MVHWYTIILIEIKKGDVDLVLVLPQLVSRRHQQSLRHIRKEQK